MQQSNSSSACSPGYILLLYTESLSQGVSLGKCDTFWYIHMFLYLFLYGCPSWHQHPSKAGRPHFFWTWIHIASTRWLTLGSSLYFYGITRKKICHLSLLTFFYILNIDNLIVLCVQYGHIKSQDGSCIFRETWWTLAPITQNFRQMAGFPSQVSAQWWS